MNAALGAVARARDRRVRRGRSSTLGLDGDAVPDAERRHDDGRRPRGRRCRSSRSAAGPSNSIRGAAALTGLADALVIDVGGTSTDVGAIAQGFPRESAAGVELGGVRTNFRMPDVVSVAAGGGTRIRDRRHRSASTAWDTGSRRKRSCSAGATPTLSDAAVAAGRATMGDRTRSARGRGRTRSRRPRRADRRRARPDEARPRRRRRRSSSAAAASCSAGRARRRLGRSTGPTDADVANAVGAAIGLVSRRGRARRRRRRRPRRRRSTRRARRCAGARGGGRRRPGSRSRPSGSTRSRSPTWTGRCPGSARRSPARPRA